MNHISPLSKSTIGDRVLDSDIEVIDLRNTMNGCARGIRSFSASGPKLLVQTPEGRFGDPSPEWA